MENPATHGQAEKVIRRVLSDEARAAAIGEFRAGLSLERQVADALRAEGLLREVPSEVRQAAYAARYGEPVDTYTWDRVVDRVIAIIEKGP